MATTFPEAVQSLAGTFVANTVYGYDMRLGAKYLITDGRARPRIWRELVAAGYLKDATPGKTDDKTTAECTAKAFDEIPAAVGFELADLYVFEKWPDDKRSGRADVVWDRLSLPQKAAVIRSVQTNPSSYTFRAFDRFHEEEFTTFNLGGGRAAVDRIGYHHAVVAVTNEAVQAKRDAAAREHFKLECEQEGLSWFLRRAGVLTKDESIPLSPKQPSLMGGGVALSRKPGEWPSSLSHAIKESRERIVKAQERLAIFERLASYVENAGGWENVLMLYNSAIESYVDKKFDTQPGETTA